MSNSKLKILKTQNLQHEQGHLILKLFRNVAGLFTSTFLNCDKTWIV